MADNNTTFYNLDLEGEEINRVLNGIFNTEGFLKSDGNGNITKGTPIFYITKGVTTFAQITEAIDNGMLPVYKMATGNYIFIYKYVGDTVHSGSRCHVFADIGSSGITYYYQNINSVWESSTTVYTAQVLGTSFDSLVSALNAALPGTIRKTWDSSAHKWVFNYTA